MKIIQIVCILIISLITSGCQTASIDNSTNISLEMCENAPWDKEWSHPEILMKKNISLDISQPIIEIPYYFCSRDARQGINNILSILDTIKKIQPNATLKLTQYKESQTIDELEEYIRSSFQFLEVKVREKECNNADFPSGFQNQSPCLTSYFLYLNNRIDKEQFAMKMLFPKGGVLEFERFEDTDTHLNIHLIGKKDSTNHPLYDLWPEASYTSPMDWQESLDGIFQQVWNGKKVCMVFHGESKILYSMFTDLHSETIHHDCAE